MTEEDSVWANCLGWRYGLMSSKEGGLTRYGIHEIYIDKDGGVVTYTVEPVMLPLYDLDLENRPRVTLCALRVLCGSIIRACYPRPEASASNISAPCEARHT